MSGFIRFIVDEGEYRNIREGHLKLHLTDYSTDELVAELSLREEITPEHEVRIGQDRFGIKHPWRCRADLIGCELNQYMENWPATQPRLQPGRYLVTEELEGFWDFLWVSDEEL